MGTDIRVAGREGGRATGVDQASLAPMLGLFGWASRRPQAILLLLTLLCLVPFTNKAFQIDDPLFIWTAKQLTVHPLDPYGFSAVWWWHSTPMWQLQLNPPLASYYMILIVSVAGWSERALHFGFILPAIVVVVGTYRLARRLTRRPFIAAAATLVAPGFLVSATSVMCDVSMLALWMLAVIFWIEGLDEQRPLYLAISGVLIAACALTKYFGVSLVPLLFAYSLLGQRSFRSWIGYLVIPVLALAAYELYTHHLYGSGMIYEAVQYYSQVRKLEGRSGRFLVGLAFAGGCALPALTFVPLLWSRKQVLLGGILSLFLGVAFLRGWVNLGTVYQYQTWLHQHKLFIAVQLVFFVAGAISILSLTLADFWKNKSDATSALLLLWIAGTLFFSIVVNWTVNVRSLLPMAPAVAILIARRLDTARQQGLVLAIPLVASGAISLWVSAGDAALANTARAAANYVHQKTRDDSSAVWFQGRWGFEYYMQNFGARPLEPDVYRCKFGDLIVLPLYNTALAPVAMKVTAKESVDFAIHTGVTTMNPDAGAGFYFSGWGPLPFVFGTVPTQRYFMARVVQEQP